MVKSKPVRDHPLMNMDSGQQQAQRFGGFGGGFKFKIDLKEYAQGSESTEVDSDDEAGGILDKVKTVSH